MWDVQTVVSSAMFVALLQRGGVKVEVWRGGWEMRGFGGVDNLDKG